MKTKYQFLFTALITLLILSACGPANQLPEEVSDGQESADLSVLEEVSDGQEIADASQLDEVADGQNIPELAELPHCEGEFNPPELVSPINFEIIDPDAPYTFNWLMLNCLPK